MGKYLQLAIIQWYMYVKWNLKAYVVLPVLFFHDAGIVLVVSAENCEKMIQEC
jgi:hypothetical protein